MKAINRLVANKNILNLRNYTVPKVHFLKENGELLEKHLQQGRDSTLGRILLEENPTGLNINYKDPKILAQWINKAAKEGTQFLNANPSTTQPVVIAVTGAAGNIGYSLLPRLARGDFLGDDVEIVLKLIDLPNAIKSLEGIRMELEDCAFPLVKDIIVTSDLKEGFLGADFVFFVGSKPRGPGQERSDVLKDNAKIFAEQGKFLNAYARSDVQCIVVGNPANTNALILSENAPDISPKNITAMTRLDHDRGLSLIAEKLNCKLVEIERFCIWGNHSATQYPDLTHTLVKGKWIGDSITMDWYYNQFIPSVQQRGAAIIKARGKSSAASAANAAIAHMRDWVKGTCEWTSMAVKGSGEYGIPSNIWSSYPIYTTFGEWQIIDGVEVDVEGAKRINASIMELLSEREAVESLLPPKSFRGLPYDSNIFSWKHLFSSVSEHIQPYLVGDFAFQEVLIKEAVKNMNISGNTPWEFTTKETVDTAVSSIDFTKHKDHIESKKYSQEDLGKISTMIKSLIWKQFKLAERRVQMFKWDLQDFEKYGNEKYKAMSPKEKYTFHMYHMTRDNKVNQMGINTLGMISNVVAAQFDYKKE